MVKRTVITRQYKKQRNKRRSKRKSRNSFSRKSNMLESTLSPSSALNTTMETSDEAKASSNRSVTVENISINNSEDASKSIILLDDTIGEADQSCFIIDVEPCNDVEKSLHDFTSTSMNNNKEYNYKEVANVSGINCERKDPLMPDEESCHSCSCNSNSSKTDDENVSNKNPINVRVSPEQVKMWKGFVDEVKNSGFLDRKNTRNHSDEDTGKSKPDTWNLFKKMIIKNPFSSCNSNSSINSPRNSPQNSPDNSNQNPDNEDKGNVEAGSKSERVSCICLDDESDSDVEFIDAFNPANHLIELSDDDNCVLVENVNPSPVIPLPKSPVKKRFGKRKRKATVRPAGTLQHQKASGDDNDNQQSESSKSLKKKKSEDETKGTRVLRPIVIDGCNVAHGHSRNGKLSVEGLKICYDYFHSRGHDVKVFLPSFRKYHPLTTNIPLLLEWENQGIVIFTPGRTVNGKKINSYDDRFIVEYAALKGAIVVSRDNYKDLYEENEGFRDTITNRVLQYTFVDDLIMFPDDPLGRRGPRLDEFLSFPDTTSNSSQSTSKS